MRFWGGLSTFVFGFAALASAASAAPLSLLHGRSVAAVSAPIVPVVVFGQDARRLPQAFAAEHDLDAAAIVKNHAASGLIQCGNAHGAGQLTLTDDVVTTAAHVLFDENGMPRAQSCNFVASVNGHDVRVPLDLASVVAGSTNPYNVAPADDWAVVRLTRAIPGAKPYGLAPEVRENEETTFVARGHIDWGGAKKLSMQDCMVHDHLSTGTQGAREFSFDCDTGDGASGGALMFGHDYSRIGAILVGWRSNRPFSAVPFSKTHYNFAVTLDGGFRRAVYAAANKMISQK